MRNFLLYLILSICLVLVVSCNKEKLKSPTASFISIGHPVINTTSGQGTNDHKITDTWVYVNGQYQGAFPIGGVIPVVAKGNADIVLYGGIKNNGISATRVPYAMYTSYQFSQNFEAGKTYTINPIYEYVSGAVFHVVENFEGSGLSFMSIGDSAYSVTSDPAKTFGGTGKSVFMGMSDAKPTSIIKTSTHLANFPPTSSTVYLEINYKCNQKIQISMLGADTEERSVITLNKTEGWNKTYVQLSEAVYTQPFYNYYDLIIKAIKQTDVANPEIYIDNIKIISL